jgi:hypothetical protein
MSSDSSPYRTTETIWFLMIAAAFFAYSWFAVDTWTMWKQLSGKPQSEGVIVAMTSEAVPIKSCSELILVVGTDRIKTGHLSCTTPLEHKEVGYTTERGRIQVVGPSGYLLLPTWLNWRLNALFIIPIAVFFLPIVIMAKSEVQRVAAKKK